MPTKHAQEDLWHLIHGGHGEYVRVVLAPTDVADAFTATSEAFRLATRFRCPAFVALDAQCSLFKQTVVPFDIAAEAAVHDRRAADPMPAGTSAWAGDYKPYGEHGEPGGRVSIPGEPGGIYYSNSTEHGPSGFTNEDPAVRQAMVQRRLARMRDIVAACRDPIVVEGPADADVVLLSWGSTVGAVREAAARLAATGTKARVVALRLLWPFPRAAVVQALAGSAPILVAEANAFAQAARLVRSELPVHDRVREVLRYDGTPLRSDDVLDVWADATRAPGGRRQVKA
jgi:2-oxoglutarate ferredoxin oxidoreductase subunit alpha